MAKTRYQAIFQNCLSVTYQDVKTGSRITQQGVWEVVMWNVKREASLASSADVVGNVLHRVLTYDLARSLVQAYEHGEDATWLH